MSSVGFIGLGNMGSHMARNLVRKGCKLMVCDVDVNRVAQLKNDGAEVAKHPAEMASACDRIITMLPSGAIVMDVFNGKNGILSTMKPNTLCIDSSTIEPKMSIELSNLVVGKKGRFIDAPVSGGVVGAENATLTFMVGGDEKEFEVASKLLKLMGQNIVNCGKVGSGEATKICNNMLLCIHMIGVSEAMNLGIKMGLDAKKLASIINTSSGRCWSSDTYNPVPGVIEGIPPSNDYQGGCSCRIIAKDLTLAENASAAADASIPLGSMAHKIYETLDKSPDFGRDFGYVYQYIKNSSYKN